MPHDPFESYGDTEFDTHRDSKMYYTGRISSVMNEDDYDYALVLQPDDEYRKAAKVLGNITDFQDADEYIDTLLEEMCLNSDDDDDENSSDMLRKNSPIINLKVAETDSRDTSEKQNNQSNDMKTFAAGAGATSLSIALDINSSGTSPLVKQETSGSVHSSTGAESFYARMFSGWTSPSSKTNDAKKIENAATSESRIAGISSSTQSHNQGNIGEIVSSPNSLPKSPEYVSPFASPIRGLQSPATPDMLSPLPIGAAGSGPAVASTGDLQEPDMTASEAIQIISKRQLLTRVGILAQKKKWVEKAARRSSMGFEKKYSVTDKAVMDAFLLAMHAGVHVRRHQAGKTSEIVRLSSSDGCRTISWGKLVPAEFAHQRLKEGVVVKKNDRYARMAAEAHIQASKTGSDVPGSSCFGALDCCGLDEDDDAGDRHRKAHMQSKQNYSKAAGFDKDTVAPPPGSFFYNFGYHYSGGFADSDIIALHPAAKSDPTAVGCNGTSELRASNDVYNAALTFSIILRTVVRSSSGYITLDLECEAEETYCLLVQGFNLLCAEASIREAKLIMGRKGAIAVVRDGAAAALSGGARLWQWAYQNSQNYLRPPPLTDPVAVLFEPTGTNGLLEKIGLRAVPDSSAGNPESTMLHAKNQKQRQATSVSDESLQASRQTSATDNKIASFLNANSADSENSYKRSSGEGISPINKLLPPAQFLGWRSAGTQIWARLKMAGLDVKVAFSWDLRQVLLKIRCPQWRLENVAEHMHMKLRNCDGSVRRFKVSRRETFVPDGSTGSLFRSSERQQIIDYILRSKIKDGGAELGEGTVLGAQIAQRFPLHMQARLDEIRHTWVTFWLEEAPGEVPQPWSPFSVPLSTTLHRMIHTVGYFFQHLLVQPLDSIAEYYGEGVAFYFAYLSFYTRWLIPPSLLGFIVFCFQMRDSQLDHWLCIPYSIIVMIWTCFLLVFWRQRSAALAYRWGVLDFEVQETERPQFKGKRYVDKHTLESRKYYSVWKRVLRYSVSVPLLLGIFLVMLVIMSTVFTTQDRVASEYKNHQPISYMPQMTLFNGITSGLWRRRLQEQVTISDFSLGNAAEAAKASLEIRIDTTQFQDPDFWAATFFYPSLYGIITNVLSALFNILAIRITDFENHRTQTEYTSHLVLKIIIFRFTTVFLALYYYAFFSKYSTDVSYTRISVTIFSMMTAGQWTGVFIDVVVPTLLHRLRLYRLKVAVSGANKQLWKAKEYADDRKFALLKQIKNSKKQGAPSDLSSSRSSHSSNSISNNDGYASLETTATEQANEHVAEHPDDGAELPLVDIEAGISAIESPRAHYDSALSRLSSVHSALRLTSLAQENSETDDYWGDSAMSPTVYRHSSASYATQSTSASSYWGFSNSSSSGRSGEEKEYAMSAKERTKETKAILVLQETIDRRAKYLEQSRSKAWEESLMSTYRSFTDYGTSVVQLGFVVFFSPVFPLAPLIALINNLCLVRLGAFKMCYTRQRPIATKTGGIGVWEDVLQIMSVLAIVTNCCLLGLTSQQLRSLLPNASDMGLAIGLFLLEHALLLFKYWLHAVIPRLPLSVHRAQAKEQLQREQSLREKEKRRSQSRRARASSVGHRNGTGGGDSEATSKHDDDDDDDRDDSTALTVASPLPADTDDSTAHPDDRPIKPMDSTHWTVAGFEQALDLIDDHQLDTRASLGATPPKCNIVSLGPNEVAGSPRRTVRFAENTAGENDTPGGNREQGPYRRSSMCVRSRNMKVDAELGNAHESGARNNTASPGGRHRIHRGKDYASDSDASNSNSDSDSHSDDGYQKSRSKKSISEDIACQERRFSWLQGSPYNASNAIQKNSTDNESREVRTIAPSVVITAQPGHETSAGSASTMKSISSELPPSTAAVKTAVQATMNVEAMHDSSASIVVPAASKALDAVRAMQTIEHNAPVRTPSWDAQSFFEKLGRIQQGAQHTPQPEKKVRTAREIRLEAQAAREAQAAQEAQAAREAQAAQEAQAAREAQAAQEAQAALQAQKVSQLYKHEAEDEDESYEESEDEKFLDELPMWASAQSATSGELKPSEPTQLKIALQAEAVLDVSRPMLQGSTSASASSISRRGAPAADLPTIKQESRQDTKPLQPEQSNESRTVCTKPVSSISNASLKPVALDAMPVSAPMSLDDKLRSIDALNDLVRNAVTFVGSVAANRSAGATETASKQKGNPFRGLLAEPSIQAEDDENVPAPEPAALTPSRGGRITKPSGSTTLTSVSTTPTHGYATRSATAAAAAAAAAETEGIAGTTSRVAVASTPSRRAPATGVSTATPVSGLRNTRSTAAHADTHKDRENATASANNTAPVLASPAHSSATKALIQPRTPIRGKAANVRVATSMADTAETLTKDSKVFKEEDKKPKAVTNSATAPNPVNPFSFAFN